MKIILRVYNEIRIGNFSTTIIDIPNNKISVKELKEKIYKKYKIKPSVQRLTYRLGFKKLITLTDSFPLNFFYIKEYSMIFLEVISEEPKLKPEERKKIEKRNLIKYKYMNRLGYFPPDEKTFEKMGIGYGYQKRKFSAFHERESKNSIKYNDDESENEKNSLIFVNSGEFNDNDMLNNDSSMKNDYNSDSKNRLKKSADFNNDKFKINKNKLKIELFSEINLVEKLSIYIGRNDLEKVKILLSQYNNYNMNNINNTSTNMDFNDSTEINSSTKHLRKISLNYGYSPKRASQAKTNYKTSSSFNSGNSCSMIRDNLNICEILNKNGWNAIHYMSFFGCDEILDYILNNYSNKLGLNLNFNLTNNEGWTPLLLAVFKQHVKCVEILLGIDNIDVNYLSDVGTALHLACKKNNRQIVSKLIYKANPLIKDKYQKIALEYTNDKSIIKLISKLVMKKFESADKNSELYLELDKFIKEYNHLLIYKKAKDIKENSNSNNNSINNILPLKIEKLPKKLPFFFGEFEQLGGFFSSNKKKFLEINPVKGLLRIFKNFEDYPKNPEKIINLIDIINIYKDEDEKNKNKNNFFFNITFFNKEENTENEFLNMNNDENIIKNVINNNNDNKPCLEKYLVHSEKVCDNIIKLINLEIKFHKFWNNIIKKNKDKKKEIINFLSNEKFKTLKLELENKKNNFILLDDLGKEIPFDENIFNDEEQNSKKNIQREGPIKRKSLKEITADDYDDNTKSVINLNSFKILSLIGKGSFGEVYKVMQKNTSKIYAMKALSKAYLLKKKYFRYALTECNVLKQSDCPFIIKLHYSFQTPDYLYMVLDYCPKGDLSYHIESYLFEEEEAKFYIAELILAIEYIHKKDIIYRDLKPDNILLDEDGHVKLADFGLAKENVKNDIPNKTFCGSPQYLSPEMLSKEGTTKASDIYGIGTILYQMVVGEPPFFSNDFNIMYKNISENNLKLPEVFSEELKDLLKKLLQKDPKKRIGIGNDKTDLKNHPFFADINWDDIANKKIPPPLELDDIREEYDMNEKVDFNDKDYNNENQVIKRVQGFTFIRNEKK